MKKLAGAAALLSGSSLLGLPLSFATQAYLAYRFGSGVEMDAYVGAMTLPALFGAVFVPSLSVVLIPVFVESMQKRGPDATWQMASNLLNVTTLVLTAGVALTLSFAGGLMRWILPGLDMSTMSLSIELLRLLLPATVLSALVATLAGLYQAQERFWPTAIAPLIGAAVLLAAAVALAPSFGMRGIALATILSNLVQLFFLLPVLRGRYRAVLDLRDSGVRTFGALLMPLVCGGLAYRTTIVADRLVASWLPKGSLSHLEYASRIVAVLNAVFASGIAGALYPQMSAQAAAGDLSRLRDTLVWGQRILMVFLFPALAIGWVLRVPLLQLMFERGQFTNLDTQQVASLLTWFMLGVVGGALGALQGRVYYVLKDMRTPVLLGLMETAAYFVYLPLMVKALGVVGIGVANAVHLLAALIVNGVVVLRMLRTDRVTDLLLDAARIGLLAAVAGGTAWAVTWMLHGAGAFVVLVTGTVAGGLCYVPMLILLRAVELRNLGSRFVDIGGHDDER